MAIPKNRQDLDQKSFEEWPDNSQLPARRVKVIPSGTEIDPRAKYVEAAYTNGNMTVTYSYYESSTKASLYTTITVNYSTAQSTKFVSAEWS